MNSMLKMVGLAMVLACPISAWAANPPAPPISLNQACKQYFGLIENFAGFAEPHWNEQTQSYDAKGSGVTWARGNGGVVLVNAVLLTEFPQQATFWDLPYQTCFAALVEPLIAYRVCNRRVPEAQAPSRDNGLGRDKAGKPGPLQLPAFPTAEGYGRLASGGRGGRVLHVTNLNDSGPGSFRAAVEASGPRTVVFDVGGLITLESRLIVRPTNSNLTIAGQTAPGKGICLRKYNFGMLGATNVIIRYLRVRPGNISGTTLDGMGMASSDNCIIDHCSISWTLDEAFSSRNARNITLQRTLISEALNEAGHKKYPPGTQHGYAASIGGDIGSFHHNLLAHCAGRNWSLAGGLSKPDNHYAGRLDIRNNVVYNWKNRATDGGAHEVNFVANYYQPGPATRYFFALNAQYGGFPGSQRYYFADNLMVGRFSLTNQTAGRTATTERGGKLPTDYSPWADKEFFPPLVKTEAAVESYTNVLADVGCNFPALDDHDQRVIAEVRFGTARFKGSKTGLPGLPDSQDDVGGWENYPEVHRVADWDTDRDGMPDHWEKAHGLDPASASDGNDDATGDGYTNLEKYLHSLVGEYSLPQRKLRPK